MLILCGSKGYRIGSASNHPCEEHFL